MDSVSNSVSRKIALEFGRSPAAVSTDTRSYPSLDYFGFVWFATRNHGVVFCFVHTRTAVAQVEFSFASGINAFHFKKCCVLPLVLEIPLTASKNGLAHSLPDTLQAPGGQKEKGLQETLVPSGAKRNV